MFTEKCTIQSLSLDLQIKVMIRTTEKTAPEQRPRVDLYASSQNNGNNIIYENLSCF